jgi:hypothetical protein
MVASKAFDVDLRASGLSAESDSVDRLQNALGLSDQEIACVLGFEQCLNSGWRLGRAARSRLCHERLRQLEALETRLRETFEGDSVRRWLRSENRYLGGHAPIDLLVTGRFDRVHTALEALDSGVFI